VTPAVTVVSPAANATLAGDASIVVTFDSDMHPTRLIDKSLVLTDKLGNQLSGTVTYDIPTRTATYKPAAFLRSSLSPYKLAVTREATNLYLIGATASSYPYQVDAVAPAVSSVAPLNAATGVSPTVVPVATLSKNVDPSSVTGATVLLSAGATSIAGTASASGAQISFKPLLRLAGNTAYTLRIKAAVTDTAGNLLGTDFVSTFTTDAVTPVVSSSVPLNNATAVSPSAPLSLTFNKAIDPASVTFTIVNPDGSTNTLGSVSLAAGTAQIQGCFAFNGASTQVTFTPLAALAPATNHVFSASSGVVDLGGLALTPATVAFRTQ
jgi:hypothetical protein